jgi:hypothetical protein
MALTIIVEYSDFLNGLFAENSSSSPRILEVERKFDKEHFIRFPFVVVNDGNVNVMLYFVRSKHQRLFDRRIVLDRFRSSVNRL